MSKFNETNWRLMLIERKRLSENEQHFSMSALLRKHHISVGWCAYINPAIEYFQAQKRVDLVSVREYFSYVKTLYENDRDKKSPSKEETPNKLSSFSLEELISELNSRGWKVYQQ